MDNLEKQIGDVTEEFFEEIQSSEEAPVESAKPIDIYQAKRNYAIEQGRKAQSYGAPASMTEVVRDMVSSIEPMYNLAVNQYNHLQEYDMTNEAQLTLDSYMENDFLPLVMGIVDQYGADALLTNRQVIDMLDGKALTGNGDGAGYTVAFVRAMAPEVQGTVASVSDRELQDGLARLENLCDKSPSAAASFAERLKERVDNGELSASQNDYALLARAASVV